MGIPTGIQLNNPGNIERRADHWQGMADDQPNDRFIKFTAPEYGARAMMVILLNKEKRGLETVEDIIMSWAPPSDNNPTAAYIAHVAGHMGVSPDVPLRLAQNPHQLLDMAQAMTIQEQGHAPEGYPLFWYCDDVWEKALRMALG